jgi:hypothetical protein
MNLGPQPEQKKRLIKLGIACGVVLLLLFLGLYFFAKPAPPKPPKSPKRVVVAVKPEKPPKPVKLSRMAAPGTLAYLDSKNGFRDVNFGMAVADLPGLALVSENPTHHLKTYTRSGDDLLVGGVPLKSINYVFFEDRLCEVVLRWNLNTPEATLRTPPSSSLAAYCAELYGPPTRHTASRQKEQTTQYIWRGHDNEVVLNETYLNGVRDQVKNTWSIPPTTAGQLNIYNKPLVRASGAISAAANARNPDGL